MDNKIHSAISHRPMLIMEDFDVVRSRVGKYFQDNGFTVISVGSIRDALSLGRIEEPEIIVIDGELQYENPFSAISAIHTALPETYIILAGDHIAALNNEEAQKLGAKRTIGRSLDPLSLHDIIEEVNAFPHHCPDRSVC